MTSLGWAPEQAEGDNGIRNHRIDAQLEDLEMSEAFELRSVKGGASKALDEIDGSASFLSLGCLSAGVDVGISGLEPALAFRGLSLVPGWRKERRSCRG